MFSPPSRGVPRNAVNPLPAASTSVRSAGQKPGERPASAARSVSDSPAQARVARAAVSTATRIDAVPELRMRVVLRSRDEERVDSARSEEVPAYTCAAERRTRNGEPAGQSFPHLPRVAGVALSQHFSEAPDLP